MRWEMTPRDWIVLSVFVTILFVGGYAYVRFQTTTPSPRALREGKKEEPRGQGGISSSPKDVSQIPLMKGTSPPLAPTDYRYIAERNIFRPPFTPRAKEKEGGKTPEKRSHPPSPPPTFSSLPPLPPPPKPKVVTSRPQDLTVTGIARLGPETYILLENPQTNDAIFVRVGESALGYEVVSVTDNFVEVRKGMTIYRFAIGEGKRPQKILARASVRPTPSRPPSPSPPNPSRTETRPSRLSRRSSPEWIRRIAERWDRIPEFVRNRILERLREQWNELPRETREEILRQLEARGIEFNP